MYVTIASLSLLSTAIVPGSSFLTSNFHFQHAVREWECNKMAVGGTDVEKKVQAKDFIPADPL